jgi:glucose-6-phosphate-specific signal transduction histidine kinase
VSAAELPPDSSHENAVARRRRRLVVGLGVIALVLVLQMASQYDRERARVLSHLLLLATAMPTLLVTLSFYYRWATRKRLDALPTLVAGAVLAAVVGAGVGATLWYFTHDVVWLHPRPTEYHPVRSVLFGAVYGEGAFGLWALAFVFPFAIEDARVRSLEADKLRLEAEKLRTAAELARLRAHLEPHFLLNTLNAIAGLVTDDPREARRLLVCLGDLLRDALRDEDEMQTLDEQIRWLRRYAEILEARHPGHLVFRWEIAGETRSVLLPRLLLQPLVENAVKHGALRRANGGEVTVRTEALGEDGGARKIVCTITDNGPGVADETRSGAFGLRAVRRRLELKYMAAAQLRLESSPSGTRSIVELPPQLEGAAAVAE